MVSDKELIKIQVEVLFTQDENGCLLGLNEPDGDVEPAPRFFLGYTNEGSICRFRVDLSENVVAQLKAVAAAEPMLMDSRTFPRSHDPFKDILQSHAPIERVWVGPAYRFPERIAPPTNVVRLSPENAGLLKGDFAKMVPELNDGRPFLAVIEDSQAVSICRSVRLSSRAHEAGVDTLDAYRRRGYATSVVVAWALAVRCPKSHPTLQHLMGQCGLSGCGTTIRLGAVWCGLSCDMRGARMVEIQSHNDASELISRSGAYLELNESENNLPIGLAYTLAKNPSSYGPDSPLLLSILEQGRAVGVAIMTPPRRLILSRIYTSVEVAMGALTRYLREMDTPIPGVAGPAAEAQAFSDCWTEGMPSILSRVATQMRVFEARTVADVPLAPGQFRLARYERPPTHGAMDCRFFRGNR